MTKAGRSVLSDTDSSGIGRSVKGLSETDSHDAGMPDVFGVRTADGMLYSFAPICDRRSRVLVLGTMASPASLRQGMYYGHPRNAFWQIVAELCGETKPVTNDEKRALLLRRGVALWDTLRSCRREGALDSDIRSAQPNDISSLLAACPDIKAVFLNGGAAYAYYKRYFAAEVKLPYYKMPSTSPANAAGGYTAKFTAWQALKPYLIIN